MLFNMAIDEIIRKITGQEKGLPKIMVYADDTVA
jgi:hypothetical protein